MVNANRLRLQLAIDQADTWVKRYHKAINDRSSIKVAAAQALKTLRGSMVQVETPAGTFAVLPVGAGQIEQLEKLAQFVQLKPITGATNELLHQLDTEVPKAIRDAARAVSARRFDEEAQDAAEFISEYVPWGLAEGIPANLDEITPAKDMPQLTLANALAPEFGLGNALKSYGTASLLPASEIRNRLATFTAAERYAQLARAITPSHEYVAICSPVGTRAQDLLAALGTE